MRHTICSHHTFTSNKHTKSALPEQPLAGCIFRARVNPGAAQEPSVLFERRPARAKSEASLAGEYDGTQRRFKRLQEVNPGERNSFEAPGWSLGVKGELREAKVDE